MVVCLWEHEMEDYGLKVMCLDVKFTKNGVVRVSANCCIDSIQNYPGDRPKGMTG